MSILSAGDLKNYVNLCKRCEFDQIHNILVNIDDKSIVANNTINIDEYNSLVNISNSFGSSTLNEAHDIYKKYYDMKGGTSSYTRRKLIKKQAARRAAKGAQRSKEIRAGHGKNNSTSASRARMNRSSSSSTASPKPDPTAPKSGFFSKAFTSMQSAVGTLDKSKPLTNAYLDTKRPLLIRINKGQPLKKYDIEKHAYKTIAEFDEWINNNLLVSDEEINKNKSRLEKINRKPLDKGTIGYLKTIKVKDFEQFMINNAPVTEKELKDNMKDLEYILGHSPLTPAELDNMRLATHEYLTNLIKNKEFVKKQLERDRLVAAEDV